MSSAVETFSLSRYFCALNVDCTVGGGSCALTTSRTFDSVRMWKTGFALGKDQKGSKECGIAVKERLAVSAAFGSRLGISN